MEMFNKREAKIVRLIVSGSMRKRRVFILIFFFIIISYISVSWVSKNNAFVKRFSDRIKNIENDVSNIQTTAANESQLKQKLLTQVRLLSEVIPISLFILMWFFVGWLWSIFLLISLVVWTNSWKDNIIKKLVDLKSSTPDKVVI